MTYVIKYLVHYAAHARIATFRTVGRSIIQRELVLIKAFRQEYFAFIAAEILPCSRSPTPLSLVPTALYVAQPAWPLGLKIPGVIDGDKLAIGRETVIGLVGQGSSIIIQVYAFHGYVDVR